MSDIQKKELIKYCKSLGLEVHTTTKARGHSGFFLKNRIDISKNLPEQKIVQTLLHEFAHYVHFKINPNLHRNGGGLEELFGTNVANLEEELFKVTNFVDENSLCVRLYELKARNKEKLLEYEKIVKSEYPKFQRSKKFKEFDKFIKKSRAKYLLKYDRVRLVTGVFRKTVQNISVVNLERDFPEISESFCAYIRLRSCLRRQARLSSKINRLQKYYKKPTELFARLVEGLYLDREWVCAIAPNATKIFFENLDKNFYPNLLPLKNYLS